MVTQIEKVRFEITFSGAKSGLCKHLILCPTKEEALKRLEAAYPDRDVTVLEVRKLVRVGYVKDSDSEPPKTLTGKFKER